jgi:8-oxo-dGTP pyrophosphatase MutT (NUDIX family)
MSLTLDGIKQKFKDFDCNHTSSSVNNLNDLENFSICNGSLLENDLLKCAVLVILFRENNQFYVIFTIRSWKLKSFPGEICFPGGKYDKNVDQSYFDTALREAEEEIGLKKENFSMVCQMCPFVSPIGHWIFPVVGILCDNTNKASQYENTLHIAQSLKANEGEVSLIFWLPLSYFLNKDTISCVEVPFKADESLIRESAFKDKRMNTFNRLVLSFSSSGSYPFEQDVKPANTFLYGINAMITITTVLALSGTYDLLEIPGFEIRNGKDLSNYLVAFRYTAFFLYKNNKLTKERKKIQAKL